MAKGDSQEMQQSINTQANAGNANLNNLRANNQSLYGSMAGNYGRGAGMNLPDYSSVMSSYNQFLGNSPAPSNGGYPTVNRPMGNSGVIPSNSVFSGLGPSAVIPAGGGQTVTGMLPSNQQQSSGNDNSTQNLQNRDKLDSTVIGIMNSGLRGQAAVDAINKAMGYDTGASWDESRGNVDISTGGNNGVQYDADANGTYGAHPYDDAGSSGGGSGSFGGLGDAIRGFQNFAQTGGFSPQDIQDIRARAIAPTRAIYQNARNDLATQMARTGGYMPNYGAVSADLARKANYGISDANVNADAAIAQMVQQGKLYGLTGMSNAQLGALSGMTGLYGTTPALANTFGNQVLQAGNQGTDLLNSQNSLASILLNAKLGQSNIPGDFQQAAGNIGTGMKLAGTAAMMFA